MNETFQRESRGESVTDTVIRLTREFRTGTKADVIREIQSMSVARAAVVSVRIYQHIEKDQTLTSILCRALEARTYHDGEVWNVFTKNHTWVFGGDWYECNEYVGLEPNLHYMMESK